MMLVTAAVIRKGRKVLIAQRKEDCPREPQKWEFPGGKVESGETPQEALRREIMEELGVRISVGEPFTVSSSRKGGTQIVLLSFMCAIGNSEPRALQCRDIRWVPAGELEGFDWAEADIPIVRKLAAEEGRSSA